MQSCDELFMYINKYPSSIKNSIDIIPLMKKRVQPLIIVPDKEIRKYPLTITSKGSKHVYIHFEQVLLGIRLVIFIIIIIIIIIIIYIIQRTNLGFQNMFTPNFPKNKQNCNLEVVRDTNKRGYIYHLTTLLYNENIPTKWFYTQNDHNPNNSSKKNIP